MSPFELIRKLVRDGRKDRQNKVDCQTPLVLVVCWASFCCWTDLFYFLSGRRDVDSPARLVWFWNVVVV